MVVINQVTLDSTSVSRKGKGSLVRGKKPTIILIISLHPLPEFTAPLSKFFQDFGGDTAVGRGELISMFD
jgi:hypothetical protein